MKIVRAMINKIKFKNKKMMMISYKAKELNQLINQNLKMMMKIKIIKLLNLILRKKEKFKTMK